MDMLIAKALPSWIKNEEGEKRSHKRKQREE
jgi:hypothetical protein